MTPNHSVIKLFLLCLLLITLSQLTVNAEKPGFPKGKKVVIFHVDAAGMSYESNMGTTQKIINE